MSDESLLVGEVSNGNIRINISEFSGHKYLDIRKYYEDDAGEIKPTKKGIALNKEQFEKILALLNEKNEEIIGLL